MQEGAPPERQLAVRTGNRLEYFTIAWNILEGLVAVIAGSFAGSISLLGFGIDSFIEVTSGAALLWRMSVDSDEAQRKRHEKRALRIVGLCFIALSIYIACEAVADLAARRAPEHSIPGIILAAVSLVIMPLLSRAKQRVGAALNSTAMRADAKQTDFCAYLSGILLIGLVLNATAGLWWADPIAAILMVPLILREGIEGLRAKPCC